MTTFHLFTIAVTSTTIFIFTHDIHAFDPLRDAIQEYQAQGAPEVPNTGIAEITQSPETNVANIPPVATDVAVVEPVVNDVIVRPIIQDVIVPESPRSIEPALPSSQIQPSTGIQSLEPALPSSQIQPSTGIQTRDFDSQALTRQLSVHSAPGILENNALDYDPRSGNNINHRRIEYSRDD